MQRRLRQNAVVQRLQWNKKILFLLAVNREYGINVTAEDSVQIDTFTQLCDCIYQKLEEKQV